MTPAVTTAAAAGMVENNESRSSTIQRYVAIRLSETIEFMEFDFA